MNPNPSRSPSAGLPGTRRSRIADYVRAHGDASVTELAAEFEVSPDTVRRDLERLDKLGQLSRTHGGATSVSLPAAALPSVRERESSAQEAKRAIGTAAARLVRPGESVLINGGSTTRAVARALVGRHDITVITCSPIIVLESRASFPVHLIGGRWNPTFGVVTGPVVLPGTTRLQADLLILGVSGLGVSGISIANIEEAEMLRQMIDSSRRVAVVCDASKFERTGFAVLAGLDEVDLVISDREPPRALADAMRREGIDVITP